MKHWVIIPKDYILKVNQKEEGQVKDPVRNLLEVEVNQLVVKLN